MSWNKVVETEHANNDLWQQKHNRVAFTLRALLFLATGLEWTLELSAFVPQVVSNQRTYTLWPRLRLSPRALLKCLSAHMIKIWQNHRALSKRKKKKDLFKNTKKESQPLLCLAWVGWKFDNKTGIEKNKNRGFRCMGGDVYFLRRQIYGYIAAHPKAHKRLQFVDPRVGELQVSKEANIQRA